MSNQILGSPLLLQSNLSFVIFRDNIRVQIRNTVPGTIVHGTSSGDGRTYMVNWQAYNAKFGHGTASGTIAFDSNGPVESNMGRLVVTWL